MECIRGRVRGYCLVLPYLEGQTDTRMRSAMALGAAALITLPLLATNHDERAETNAWKQHKAAGPVLPRIARVADGFSRVMCAAGEGAHRVAAEARGAGEVVVGACLTTGNRALNNLRAALDDISGFLAT